MVQGELRLDRDALWRERKVRPARPPSRADLAGGVMSLGFADGGLTRQVVHPVDDSGSRLAYPG